MDAGSADGPGPRPDDAAAQPVAVLEELLAARGEHLLRTAVLLAGSRADGEDLLQAALERLFRRWRTIRGDPEGYLRRTLYHLAADGWRRNGAWRARLRLLGHPASVPDGTDAVDQRDQIIRLLSALPPRQRDRGRAPPLGGPVRGGDGPRHGLLRRARSRPRARAACAGSASSATALAGEHGEQHLNRQGERHEHRLRGPAAGRDGTGPGAPPARPGPGGAPAVRQEPTPDRAHGRRDRDGRRRRGGDGRVRADGGDGGHRPDRDHRRTWRTTSAAALAATDAIGYTTAHYSGSRRHRVLLQPGGRVGVRRPVAAADRVKRRPAPRR